MELLAGASGLARRISHSYTGIQVAAVTLSLVFTALVVVQDRMPNDDGVLYLYSAELIAAGDWARALQLFNWPFYSFLIAAVHKISGLGPENAAHLLNALLQALTVYAFIGVAAAAGARREVLLSAALLILIYPEFNDYRAAIIRDFGYWAFSMLALMYLLKGSGQGWLRYMAGWIVALVLAALFRIEGLVLLGVFPLLLLFDSAVAVKVRIHRMLFVYGAMLLGVVAVLMVLVISGTDVLSLQQWNKPVQMVTDFYAAVSSDFTARAQILRDHFLIRYSHEYATAIVLLSMLVILLGDVMSSIGFVFLAFALYALVAASTGMAAYARKVVLSLAVLNFLMLAAFVAMLGFLAGRYPVGLVLLAMVFAAFGALPLYERLRGWAQRRGRGRWVTVVFALMAVFFLVDGVAKTTSGKVHVEQAAHWLRDNVAAPDRVLSIDYPLLYRAEKIEFDDYLTFYDEMRTGGNLRLMEKVPFSTRLAASDWRAYQYVATTISRKDPLEQGRLEQLIGAAPLKEFRNRKGDRVVIYRIGSAPRGTAAD